MAQAVKVGLDATLQEAFGLVRPFPQIATLGEYTQKRAELVAAQRSAGPVAPPKAAAANPATAVPDPAAQARQKLNQEINQLERQSFLDYVQSWLAFAAKPENSAQENLVMFLSNVLVVAQSKVKDPTRLYAHTNLLRAMWQKSYPNIIKAVTYSPAMIQYLDLNTNERNGPNENYAREVMELFTLGEGHYTESDIKEAARALTGIVITNEVGTLVPRRWDPGTKTIFGKSGIFGANDVVDLIFQQPASHTHLPKRFLAYYLTTDPLPPAYLDELGLQWQRAGLRVVSLARQVFSSQLFYRPEYRGALIKSPIQYYLGLCQDLNIDVSPFEGQIFNTLRAMGQEPFNPPNVRGWLAGKNWINSSTFAARRQMVQQMFNPTNEKGLTADLQAKLAAARAAGQGVISMDNQRLQALAEKSTRKLRICCSIISLRAKPPPPTAPASLTTCRTTRVRAWNWCAMSPRPCSNRPTITRANPPEDTMNNLPQTHLPTTRREFLKFSGAGLGLLAFSAYAPRFLTQAAAANVPAPEKDKRILVLLQLAGGNDGLNTVVPYADDRYYKLRPRLGFKDATGLHKLDDHVALAPPCGAIADLAQQGKFAVIQNVGYPNPNRSHFRSSEIWETASDSETFLPDGWMGRYLDNCCSGTPTDSQSHDPLAVHTTGTLPQSFFSEQPHNLFSVSGNSRANARHAAPGGRRGVQAIAR